jgi:predicted ABC-type exoprotein transport system permease subunit
LLDSPYYSESELCGDVVTIFFFFEVHPLASNVLLTMLHLLLKNVLQIVDHFEISCLSSLFMVGKAQKSHGVGSELNSVFGLEKVDWWNPIRKSAV